jgi:hypothetical protein
MPSPDCGALFNVLGMCDDKTPPPYTGPQPVSRFPTTKKTIRNTPPTPNTRNVSKSSTPYTGPQPVSRFPEGVKKATPPPSLKNISNEVGDNIDKITENLGLDKLGIPKEAVPIILVGGVLVVVYFILR